MFGKPVASVRLMAAMVGVIAVVVVVAFIRVDPLDLQNRFRLIWSDLCFRMRRPPRASEAITHIDIDNRSISEIGRWPWPRTIHAELVDTLNDLGARLIVFDVEFSEPSRPHVNEDYVRAELADGVLAAFDSLRALVEVEDAESTDELARAAADARADVEHRLAEVVTNPDVDFAAAVRRAGNVILAYSLQAETPAYHATAGREKLRALEHLLSARPDAGAAEAAGASGIPESDLDNWLEQFRETFLVGLALDFMAANPEDTAADFVAHIQPATSGGTAILPAAFNAAGARRLVVGASAVDGNSTWRHEAAGALVPILALARSARGFGFTNTQADPADGVFRRLRPIDTLAGEPVMYLGLAAACEYLGVPPEEVRLPGDGSVVLSGTEHPERGERSIVMRVDSKSSVTINWPQSPSRGYFDTFKHVPYVAVIDLARVRSELDRRFEQADAGYRMGRLARNEAELRARGLPSDELAMEIKRERTSLIRALERMAKRGRNQILAEDDAKRRADLEREIRPLEEHIDHIAELEARRNKLEEFLRPRVAGALCIVGAAFTAGTDFHPTPVEPAMPGAGLVSAVANMVITRQFVQVAGSHSALVIAGLMGVIVVAIGVSMRPLKALGACAGFVFMACLAAFLAFDGAGLLYDVSGGIMASAAGFLAVVTYREFAEERHKRFIRHAFEHYLSPEVVGQLVRDPSALSLGGQKREVTILFGDLQGFTRFAEGMSPSEVVDFLNRFLGILTDAVMDCGGYLDKYEGDAILAVFGAPVATENHAVDACRCAVALQRGLSEIELAGKPVHCRVGICTGEVVVGNIGSRERFDYTVIGDTVNVAARLEAANKCFGTRMMISAETAGHLPESFRLRRLGRLRLEGRDEPMEAHELLADQTVVMETYEPFNQGVAAFEAGTLEEAASHFAEAIKAHLDDGAAAAFLDKCRYLLERPPATWDGLFYARIK